MVPTDARNDFLLDLLDLQQDGKYAISAPSNWTNHEPLLEVPTQLDGIIGQLQECLLRRTANDTACWHFFIGSPGNGKSAAIGKLCRGLMREQDCRLYDENGSDIKSLGPSSIPYAIDVREGTNKFATVKIVQDASVVRNPFSSEIDPARDLLDTLEDAWERGISLVVCTNRGILEKLHRDNHTTPRINRQAWFKIVKALVNATTPSGEIGNDCNFDRKNKRGTIFKKVKIGYNHLDNHSLLSGEVTFDKLIQSATTGEHWSCCTPCTVSSMCPFKANRDWLDDSEARERVIELLRRAEVLSGQVVVFREALAIISLLLAGCPKDYDSLHPCAWVKSKVTSGDIFSLASRRIYMSLFSPNSPRGLDSVEDLRKKQVVSFNGLRNVLCNCKPLTLTAIKHVVDNPAPSIDVGVTRLLGENKTLASLDPWREDLPGDFYERWDSDYDIVPVNSPPYITDIERSCISVWKELEENLEQSVDCQVSEAYWALRRWSSNFLLHLGGLKEGYSAWSKELDDFTSLLELMDKPTRTVEDRRKIREVEGNLENLLNTSTTTTGTKTVKLSENVTLSGQWVVEKLKPVAASTEASGSVSLAIKFKGGRRGGERAVLAAPMYLWLRRRGEGHLDERCFPQELLIGISDARVRAASKGEYAVANNDVELVIKTGNDESFKLTRFDGEVDVTHG